MLANSFSSCSFFWTDNPFNETAVYDCMTGKREDGSPSEDNKVIGFRLVWQE